MTIALRIAALLLPLVAGCDPGGSTCGSRDAVIAELPGAPAADEESCEEPPRCEAANVISTCIDGERQVLSCADVCNERGLSPDECAENEDGVDECVCVDDSNACG